MSLVDSTELKSEQPVHCRALAFEMQTGGHHPSYIRNFALQWAEKIPAASIDFIVTRLFFDLHSEVVQLVNSVDPGRIRIHCLETEEDYRVRVESRLREFAGWKIFCRYARKLKADKAMLMYSDHFQIPMLTGQRSPCPVSCIYFRPTFHYGQFREYQPTWKQRLAAWRKQLLVRRLLKMRQLDALYCLDPFAVEYIEEHFSSPARIRRLPDSFVRHEIPAARLERLKDELGVQPGRKALLLLGILDSRKGPIQLLDAIAELEDDVKRRACLLIVGKIDPSIEAEVIRKCEELSQQQLIQIVLKNEYITDTLVQDYYQVSDIALTTYQQHMGMSSALIRAALAGIPVLSSSYGLMGELVQRHRLGLVVDTAQRSDFARGLKESILLEKEQVFDGKSALHFAASHSPDALGETLREWIAGA